ncbi:cytochrome P450 [Actinomadura sp. ATCC 31491]|uniref:Cytochrome P450 n=1 Tax=Actinomadura luzonensis TaxID=2805427 RepID=A0ABT0G4W6_9ACTN|nr:cytochrome P450 [Actinomadura luzonensis]MCK2219225.1 cytochrome P450 [Actinomadura luzonensis]
MPTITRLPVVTPAQSLALAATLVLPTVAQGTVIRRPAAVRLAGMADTDARAIGLLRRLRARYGDGPLLARVPGRGLAMLPLAAADVRRVLEDPAFTPATEEKRGALAHFEPDAVLVTRDPELRERRRELNERVLCAGTAAHARVAEEESAALPREGTLTWPQWHAVHWRVARRVVLGDAARDDVLLTTLLDRLRRDANWSYLRGRRTDVRDAFRRRLAAHLERAEPGSLAGALAAAHAGPEVHPEGQAPHWLFSFDAAAVAGYRALALLTAFPGPRDEAHLRAAALESLRLWPTTLAILREAAGPNPWDLPPGTLVVVYSPYVNRAEPGDNYRPGLWLDGGESWAGVPFSAGFARCPGRDLVLTTTAALLRAFLRERSAVPSLTLEDPLPAALDHIRLRFTVNPAER